ncbi:short chain dehydrogenase, partial [Rhizobium leguminosarum]
MTFRSWNWPPSKQTEKGRAVSDINLNAPKLFDLSGQVAIVTGAGSG